MPFRIVLSSLIASLAAAASAQTSGAAAVQRAAASADVPRAQYINVQDGEFRKMDADKNGHVTRAEVESFQRMAAVATARARNQQLFAQLDADRNGQLSPAEFTKFSAPPPPVNGQPFITQMDGNKDGQVSLIEHRAGKLAHYDRIDTDKDGVVTPAEMRAAGVIK